MDNKFIIRITLNITEICKKHIRIKRFFRHISYIFRFIFKHSHNLYHPLPYFILLFVFIVELYNKQFYYLYYIIFINMMIKIKRDLQTYISERSGSVDLRLSKYFYKNTLEYKKQRLYFYNENNMELTQNNKSKENIDIIRELSTIIDVSFDDFKSPYGRNYPNKNKIKGIYRRFWIIIICVSMNYFILTTNIKLGLIFLLIIFLIIYLHYYTFYIPKYVLYQEMIRFEKNNYKYSKKHNILFWVIIIIQGYIYWLILLKPELTFMDNNILLNIFDNWIQVIRIYTVEEKVQYLYAYFEYYITSMNFGVVHEDYIRYLLRNINHAVLIDNEVTLKDLQIYIKLFVDNYYFNEIIYSMHKQHICNITTSYNQMYVLLRNSLIIGAVMLTLSRLNFLWLTGKDIGIAYDKMSLLGYDILRAIIVYDLSKIINKYK